MLSNKGESLVRLRCGASAARIKPSRLTGHNSKQTGGSALPGLRPLTRDQQTKLDRSYTDDSHDTMQLTWFPALGVIATRACSLTVNGVGGPENIAELVLQFLLTVLPLLAARSKEETGGQKGLLHHGVPSLSLAYTFQFIYRSLHSRADEQTNQYTSIILQR